MWSRPDPRCGGRPEDSCGFSRRFGSELAAPLRRQRWGHLISDWRKGSQVDPDVFEGGVRKANRRVVQVSPRHGRQDFTARGPALMSPGAYRPDKVFLSPVADTCFLVRGKVRGKTHAPGTRPGGQERAGRPQIVLVPHRCEWRGRIGNALRMPGHQARRIRYGQCRRSWDSWRVATLTAKDAGQMSAAFDGTQLLLPAEVHQQDQPREQEGE